MSLQLTEEHQTGTQITTTLGSVRLSTQINHINQLSQESENSPSVVNDKRRQNRKGTKWIVSQTMDETVTEWLLAGEWGRFSGRGDSANKGTDVRGVSGTDSERARLGRIICAGWCGKTGGGRVWGLRMPGWEVMTLSVGQWDTTKGLNRDEIQRFLRKVILEARPGIHNLEGSRKR